MSLVDHDCICIRHWDYSETSQTVGLFSRDAGLIRAIAKGSRRDRGAFGGGVDVLTRGMAGLSIRKGRDLSTLGRWHLSRTWPRLRTDLEANHAAFLFADVTARLMMPHDPHPEVFDGLAFALDELDQGESVHGVVVRMLWCLLVGTGHAFRLPAASRLGHDGNHPIPFFPHDGGFEAGEGAGPSWPVQPDTVRMLVSILSSSTESELTHVAEVEAPGSTARAARLLAAHVREIIGSEPPTLALLYPQIAGPHAMATIAGWRLPTTPPHSPTGSNSTRR
ncbi:MAG: DNA repair protein RecO [Planctomycetota bacterium]|nr:DNA repair protein RecO [Planctomycetota bacterium]MDA1105402.1 DNA repair protein RecO [Planctomycetota bacterium]